MLLREQLAHDEAVTYVAATGHMGAFERAVSGGLTGKWEPATTWKALIQPGPFWDFGTIRSDLARYDNHPPLYFWLLHIWIAGFGLTRNSGILLNIGIALVTGFLLFGFARSLPRGDLQAALVPAVWTLSPPVVATSLQARQYDLLAFFTVAFVWLLTWLTGPRTRLRWWSLALLALAAAGGLLSHYHFAIVLAGGGVFAALRLWRVDRRRLAWLVGTALAGVALFVAGQPLFYLSLERQTGQSSTPTWGGAVERAGNVVSAVGAFFGSADAPWLLLGFGALAVAAGVAVRVRRRGTAGPDTAGGETAAEDSGTVSKVAAGETPASGRLQGRWAPPLFFLFWIGGATILLYLTFRSPIYAMHDRYLAAVWPFLAFVPLLLAGVFGRYRTLVVAALCLAVLLPGSIGRALDYKPRTVNPVPSFRRAHHLVIVGVGRGNLTRVLWHVPKDKLVFVDRQAGVYEKKSEWLPALVDKDIYVDKLGDPGDDPVRAAEMLDWLRGRFELRRPGSVWGLFEMWRLYPADQGLPD